MIESREDPMKPAEDADALPLGRAREPLSPVESAFARELFERYQLSLYRYLTRLLHSREEAQEILQETYLRILRQPTFEHVRANARAYLFQTATNLARDLFRQKALRGIESERALFSAGGLDSPDWDSWPELALEAEQAGRAIVDVLQELDPPVRSALLLHRFRGLKQQQIAEWLGVSERTVERYIKEGLTRIAARLKVSK
jgi:RNA polymerase sigma-70 factor (ECF subfamily)